MDILRLGALGLSASLLLVGARAAAQGAPPATSGSAAPSATAAAQTATQRADALYGEGQTLVKAGKFDEACKAFEESQSLDPSDATLFNLADCEERRGRWIAAVKRWREALSSPKINAEDKAAVTERLALAEKQIAHLKLRIPPNLPAGTTVTLDGQPLSPKDWTGPIPVDPGDHKLTVTSPGREPGEAPVKPKAGESPEVPLPLGKELVPPPPPDKPPPPPEKAPSRAVTLTSAAGISRHYLTYSSLLVGAGLGVGAVLVGKDILDAYHVFAPKCMSAPSPCPESEFEAIRARERNANILVAGAVVFGVLAPILYFTVEGGPFERRQASAPSQTKVGFGLGPGSATLDLQF